MKTLNIAFEDAEYEKLVAKKEKMSWHDFIMMLSK